jgi:hypothetical protein
VRARALRALWALLVTACAPEAAPPVLETSPASIRAAAWVTGDELALPPLKHLLERFTLRLPRTSLRVEAPLGAEGALSALADGAVDLVAIARPGNAPRLPGAVEFARTRAVLVTSGGQSLRRLTVDRLVQLVEGNAVEGAGEERALFRLRPEGELTQSVLAQGRPRLAQAFAVAARERRWPVVHQASALRAELRARTGMVAVVDSGSLRLFGEPLWPVFIEGEPTDDRISLDLLRGPAAGPEVDAFLQFLQGAEGRAFLIDLGYEVP